MLIRKTYQILEHLEQLLAEVSPADYVTPIAALQNATIGQHVRHILELFECLLQSQATRRLDYDQRQRNIRTETDQEYALSVIHNVRDAIDMDNFDLTLVQKYQEDLSDIIEIPSTYYRELIFNIEHAIHHQATIRMGMQALCPRIQLPISFGVADSTLHHRNHVHAHLSA